jgi:hypothetical protein
MCYSISTSNNKCNHPLTSSHQNLSWIGLIRHHPSIKQWNSTRSCWWPPNYYMVRIILISINCFRQLWNKVAAFFFVCPQSFLGLWLNSEATQKWIQARIMSPFHVCWLDWSRTPSTKASLLSEPRHTSYQRACLVAIFFAKWHCSKFRCYLVISVQSWSN